jgi:hypothetical protein
MIYSKNAAMAGTRSWFAPSLGCWHSYKQGNIQVFRAFRHEFLAQLHFEMFPAQPWFANLARLPKLVLLFSWIRLAYPAFRQNLKDAITQMRLNEESTKAGYVHLKNLEFMCEWCIPLVSVWDVAHEDRLKEPPRMTFLPTKIS